MMRLMMFTSINERVGGETVKVDLLLAEMDRRASGEVETVATCQAVWELTNRNLARHKWITRSPNICQ
jgi:hypothetical protein